VLYIITQFLLRVVHASCHSPFQGSIGAISIPTHFAAPKKLFFVYELHVSSPSAAPAVAAAPSSVHAVFGCECDCGVTSYTFLSCKDGRWVKLAATVEFKCVSLIPAKEAHALSMNSSSWLRLMGVEECKHKLPLSWILPPEAVVVTSGSSVGPYATVTLLPSVLASAAACLPFRPLVSRLLSQQPVCLDLPCWFVKTKHRFATIASKIFSLVFEN
jgi:hypothetical protein